MSTEIKADVVGSEAGSAETKRDANTWSVEEGHDDALVDEEPRKVKKTKMTEAAIMTWAKAHICTALDKPYFRCAPGFVLPSPVDRAAQEQQAAYIWDTVIKPHYRKAVAADQVVWMRGWQEQFRKMEDPAYSAGWWETQRVDDEALRLKCLWRNSDHAIDFMVDGKERLQGIDNVIAAISRPVVDYVSKMTTDCLGEIIPEEVKTRALQRGFLPDLRKLRMELIESEEAFPTTDIDVAVQRYKFIVAGHIEELMKRQQIFNKAAVYLAEEDQAGG